ncbi:MAG: hypothetical protein ACI4MP_00045, partial [Candidatus Ventricola sp.]
CFALLFCRAPDDLTLQGCSEGGAGTARFPALQEIAFNTVQRAPSGLTLQSCSEVGAGTARFLEDFSLISLCLHLCLIQWVY